MRSSSTLIGAGTALPLERRDLYGNSRPLTASFDIGANQHKDSDGDGMQDDWETKHSLNPGSSGENLPPPLVEVATQPDGSYELYLLDPGGGVPLL